MSPHQEKLPKLAAPVQAPPVYRDNAPVSAGRGTDSGVDAAASGCADLPGAARQLCYAMRSTKV